MHQPLSDMHLLPTGHRLHLTTNRHLPSLNLKRPLFIEQRGGGGFKAGGAEGAEFGFQKWSDKWSGVGVSRSRISQLAAEAKENGENGKMVEKWGGMGKNGGNWGKMGGNGTASMNAIYTGPYNAFSNHGAGTAPLKQNET